MASPDGIHCIADTTSGRVQPLDNPNPNLFCFTSDERMALAFTAETAFASLLAVILWFALIGRNYLLRGSKAKLIQRPIEVYLLSLFAAELLQALGGAFDVKWAHEGRVYTGATCTAQGLIQQVGETAVAMSTIAITVYTFVLIWWKRGSHAMKTARIVVALIWLYVLIFSIVHAAVHDKQSNLYYLPTPYWCWIGSKFMPERIAGEYVWLWIGLISSILLYIPLYFWSRGHITPDPNVWYKFSVHKRQSMPTSMDFALLVYPISYAVVTLPLSVVRWSTFQQKDTVPINVAATFTVVNIFELSGVLNVVLFFFTRAGLFLFSKEGTNKDKETASSDDGDAPLDEGMAPDL